MLRCMDEMLAQLRIHHSAFIIPHSSFLIMSDHFFERSNHVVLVGVGHGREQRQRQDALGRRCSAAGHWPGPRAVAAGDKTAANARAGNGLARRCLRPAEHGQSCRDRPAAARDRAARRTGAGHGDGRRVLASGRSAGNCRKADVVAARRVRSGGSIQPASFFNWLAASAALKIGEPVIPAQLKLLGMPGPRGGIRLHQAMIAKPSQCARPARRRRW